MLPAMEVSIVLFLLVNRLLSDSPNAVVSFILGIFFLAFASAFSFSACLSCSFSSSPRGLLSLIIFPSSIRTILVEYLSARSGLCVTITTSLSAATFFRISMTMMPVSVSSAPVGSSSRIISGSFTRALAIATLCICPPDISAGLFLNWSPSPTAVRASSALCLLLFPLAPERLRASSTFLRTV